MLSSLSKRSENGNEIIEANTVIRKLERPNKAFVIRGDKRSEMALFSYINTKINHKEGGYVMNELSVVSTITEVVKTSRDIYQDFSQNRTVSKYRKWELRDTLDAYIVMRKGQNKARIFDSNMQILERCYRTIETLPANTPLYEKAMRQFNILADSLERLLVGYN